MIAGLLGWFIFSRDERFQLRGLLSYLLIWIVLGVIAATIFASVGPCYYQLFYGSDRFAPLVAQLRADNARYALFAPQIMERLYNTRNFFAIGAGISAFPSIHVGMSFLFFLAVRNGLRRTVPTLLAAAYALLMWVASVHLGWHYASDGLVSVAGVGAIWLATGHFVAWLERPGAPRALRDTYDGEGDATRAT